MTSRTYLYVSANDADALEAAFQSEAETVVCDLEDSVPADQKAAAREHLLETLSAIDADPDRIGIRVNGIRTDYWLQDMMTVIDAEAQTLILPMVEEPADLQIATAALNQLSDDPPDVLFQLETPTGLFSGRDIALQAKQLPAVTAVTLGLGDYTAALGAESLPEPIVNTLGLFILSIASIGDLDPIATVYRDVADIEGLEERAAYYRTLGFQGQSALDERQVPIMNAVY